VNPPAPAGPDAEPDPRGRVPLGPVRWALLFANFAIGCGLMVVPGSLNDLIRSLDVPVAAAGQLISVAAVVIAFGAPLLAAALASWDRRRLLTVALAWYGIGHLLCALMPGLTPLLPARALTMLGAAVVTPQAAAAIAWLTPPEHRGRAITFIFLGWSAALVFGMPLHSYIGQVFGWRYAFGVVSVMSAVGAWWLWRALPNGVRPPTLPLAAWVQVARSPTLLAVVAVTALFGAGQFTLMSYFAPLFQQVLLANPLEISLLFGWFGLWGLGGNVLLSRYVDRVGPGRVVYWLCLCMLLSLALWPLGTGVVSMALVLIPWAFAGFASNSAQQARLGAAAPTLAPALMALNTSAIYAGQALGAFGGGWRVSANEAVHAPRYDGLPLVAAGWIIAAALLSTWARRRMERAGAVPSTTSAGGT